MTRVCGNTLKNELGVVLPLLVLLGLVVGGGMDIFRIILIHQRVSIKGNSEGISKMTLIVRNMKKKGRVLLLLGVTP